MFKVYGRIGSNFVKNKEFDSMGKATAYLDKILERKHLDVIEVFEDDNLYSYVCTAHSKICIEVVR